MDKDIQEKIGQIQMVQQNMHNLASQRQQFQLQQAEVETALAEIDASEKTYKIIGNIMVSVDKVKIKEDLEEKRQMLDVRIKSIEKQETNLRDKAESIQKEVLQTLEQKDKKKAKNE